MPTSPELRAEQRRIVGAISKIGPVVPGTLLSRSLNCANPRCRCHAEPPQTSRPLLVLDPQSEQHDREQGPDP